MQDQNVQQIVEQLSMAIQKSETEERIKAKMASWNSRQIKNLGNRYTPDLNIPVEIMDSLHGASVDQQFQNIFYDKVDKFLIAMRHSELSEINALCDAIEKYAIELNFFNITSSDIDVIISGVDFMGRWMPEAQSNSAMYNKEYYWSDAHTFFNNPYYCGLEWVNIDSDHLNCVFPEKVLIPVKQYYSERKGELNSLNSEIASIYWHKPCEEMYTKLQLKYLKGSNSAFVDGAGELVCFESSELIGNDTGFYIRYDKLLEFLKSSSYTLVWTSLCEKRILTPSFGKWDLPPKAIHMSSVYYLKDGKIAKASETLFEDRLYY